MSRAKGTADLSPQTVIAIREAAASGREDEDIAEEHGIKPTRVADIRLGKTFARIGGPRTEHPRGGSRCAACARKSTGPSLPSS